MNSLVFVPLLSFILVAVALGAIPGVLASRKHRSCGLWWVAGAFGFPIALVSILCLGDFERIPAEQRGTSKLKEKIVLVVILVLWAAMIVTRIERTIR